jgi:DnaJ-class molecular chaperone
MTVTLKERCSSCYGTGNYSVPPHISNPCWSCAGKGWVTRTMKSPDPKWARLYKKGVAFGDKEPAK